MESETTLAAQVAHAKQSEYAELIRELTAACREARRIFGQARAGSANARIVGQLDSAIERARASGYFGK